MYYREDPLENIKQLLKEKDAEIARLEEENRELKAAFGSILKVSKKFDIETACPEAFADYDTPTQESIDAMNEHYRQKYPEPKTIVEDPFSNDDPFRAVLYYEIPNKGDFDNIDTFLEILQDIRK